MFLQLIQTLSTTKQILLLLIVSILFMMCCYQYVISVKIAKTDYSPQPAKSYGVSSDLTRLLLSTKTKLDQDAVKSPINNWTVTVRDDIPSEEELLTRYH